MQRPSSQRTAIWRDACHGPGVTRRADGTRVLGAVVAIVRVTGTVVVEDVRLTIEGLKLQVLPNGKLEHIDGDSAAEPVKPFCPANVSVVDPDCPGPPTLTTIGLALIMNPGVAMTVSVSVAEEAA
jgi:hypothetical protein